MSKIRFALVGCGRIVKKHLEALKEHGPCEIHRMSYKPVKESIK